MAPPPTDEDHSSLLPLLKRISASASSITAEEITDAITRISLNHCHPVQTGALLTAMHYTALDTRSDIIAGASRAMRNAGLKISFPHTPLPLPTESTGKTEYKGGLVDMVGTGGDGHDTFNVSTTAAVVVSGCGVRVCKHGSKASTSTSGSADLLMALGAHLPSVTAPVVSSMFTHPSGPSTNFTFIYAPNFHPAMQHIAVVRKLLGLRTIFNVLGPLISPVDYSYPGGLEARVLGVGRLDIGPIYAETLKLLGVRRALVVCGAEQLDEISPAGESYCWRLREGGEGEEEVAIEEFKVEPVETFGMPALHALSQVAGGRGPEENAEIFRQLLTGKVADGDPVKDFVLINAAALLVVSGAVEGEEELGKDGIMRGSLWRNAVEKARKAMDDGVAMKEWEKFVEISKKAQREEAGGL